MNIAPALMPATWTVLAYFYIRYDMNIFLVVIIGATMAAAGRIVLSNLSRTILRPRIGKKMRENLTALGLFLGKNRKLSIPLVISYAFLPIPSNQVFIATGLAGIEITPIIFSFWVGRLISYNFWVRAANRMFDNFEGLFTKHFARPESALVEIIWLILLMAISMIDWAKILKIERSEVLKKS